jgi:hypothetical protein
MFGLFPRARNSAAKYVLEHISRTPSNAARDMDIGGFVSRGESRRRRPMAKRISSNEWCEISQLDALPGQALELVWLPVQMTDGAFMASLCLLAFEAEKLRSRAILIDARNFKHQFGEGVMAWRDAYIIPRYGSAGVRKFAFLMPAGFPNPGSESFEPPAVFPTKWFIDRGAALDWLKGA